MPSAAIDFASSSGVGSCGPSSGISHRISAPAVPFGALGPEPSGTSHCLFEAPLRQVRRIWLPSSLVTPEWRSGAPSGAGNKQRSRAAGGSSTTPRVGSGSSVNSPRIWVRQPPVSGRPLTASTAQGYRALLRRHLIPGSGASCPSAVSPACVAEDCSAFSAAMSTRSTAPRRWSAKPMSSRGWVGCSLPPSRKPAAARSRSPPWSFVPWSTTSRTAWQRLSTPSSAWSNEARTDGSEKYAPKQGQQLEAAGGIEPPYGALQAPA